MKFLRLISLPLAAFAAMATLTGCGDTASPTGLTSDVDSTPPPAPASVYASYEVSGAKLIWDASAAADVVGYQVYLYSPSPERDNAYVLVDDADPSDTSFDVTLEDHPQSIYRVRAVDASGNTSAFSASVAVQFQNASGGGSMKPIHIDPN